MDAAALTSSARPASQRTICPQNRKNGESWSIARGPCCQLRVVSPQKTAVRPRSSGWTANTGIEFRLAPECVASTVAPGRGPSTRVQPSSVGKPGRLRLACLRGEEAADVGEDRMANALGRQHAARKASVTWPMSVPPRMHRQRLRPTACRVAARPQAVIAAQHDQTRPRRGLA